MPGSPKAFYPIFLDLAKRDVVLLGGHRPALEKVRGLLAAGARVTVVAPRLEPELSTLVAEGKVFHRPRPYRPGDLVGAFLALSVLADPEANDRFWAEAQALGIPANVMDDPPRCSFIAPAVVRRGDLGVAISTGGKAPALAVRLRERLEGELGEEHARFLELAGRLRAPLASRHPQFGERKAIWYRLVDSEILELLARGEVAAAWELASLISGVEAPELAPPPGPVPS